MFKLDALPRLAIGSHEPGSGKACIMNAISYLSGDVRVTDLPSCVFRPLAYLSQAVNDGICPAEHRPDDGYGQPEAELCPACTHKVWVLGTRLIGSASVSLDERACLEIGDRWCRTGIGWLVQRGVSSEMIAAMTNYLDGVGCAAELRAAICCPVPGEYLHDLCRDVRVAAQALVNMLSFAVGTPQWWAELVQMVRNCFSQRLVAEQFGELIDIFEDVTFFLATPPTPEEVRAMAKRVNLVMV